MSLIEWQLDRLVGPTHHFGGLGVGNVASQRSAGTLSNPAAAALQGLEKMRWIAQATGAQLIVPPQPRPDFEVLRNLGFSGSDADVLKRARDDSPDLLSAATSCSAMWTANAATVVPDIDCMNHDRTGTSLSVANLVSSIHRTTEPSQSQRDLKKALPDSCRILPPLKSGYAMRDEGAANHMRLSVAGASAGIHVFVYGDQDPVPTRYQARQSLASCRAIARRHDLVPENVFFLKQHPDAIDAGAFHNDVVAMSHLDRWIHHADAFFEASETYEKIESRFHELFGQDLIRISVAPETLSLPTTVGTYLFNSQIISRDTDSPPKIVCTRQVEQNPSARRLVEQWCQSEVFQSVHYVDLDQSMSGGGGPACLRLRIPLPIDLSDTIPKPARFSESSYDRLRDLVQSEYSTELMIDDLARIDFHQQASETQRKVVRLLTTGQ
ncbi:MAG: N-succinylarginine dihydrolase [Planctomycetota bacterium]